jgi:hypothetical protein
MFTQATAKTDYRRAFEREQGPARAGAASPSTLDQIYTGKREAGHPVMFVVGGDGTERMFAPALGWFDWGWPSMGPTRRLARALLLDVTGREPPPGIRDALLTEVLAHFPWAGFSISGRELVAWIESRGQTIADWPAAHSTPGTGILAAAPSRARDRSSRGRLAAGGSRARVPSRGLQPAFGAPR